MIQKDINKPDRHYAKGLLIDWLFNGEESGISVSLINIDGFTGGCHFNLQMTAGSGRIVKDIFGGTGVSPMSLLHRVERNNMKGEVK